MAYNVEKTAVTLKYENQEYQSIGVFTGDSLILRTRGLCLCWIKDGKRFYDKLLHKGAVESSGLCIHHNGIDYVVAKEMHADNLNNPNIFEDCGNSKKIKAGGALDRFADDSIKIIGGTEQGLHAYGVGVNTYTARQDPNALIDFDLSPTFTIATEFKISSSSEPERTSVFNLRQEGTGAYTYKYAGNRTVKRKGYNLFHLFTQSYGTELVFVTHFDEFTFNIAKDVWIPFTATFSSTGRETSVDGVDGNVYIYNYAITCGEDTQTGNTFINTLLDTGIALGIGCDGDASRNVENFYGDIKYFSLSEDNLGYSTYRRSAHKLLFHFD